MIAYTTFNKLLHLSRSGYILQSIMDSEIIRTKTELCFQFWVKPKSGNCGRFQFWAYLKVETADAFSVLGLHRHKALWFIMICHSGRNRKISRTQDWSKNGTKFQILFYVSHRTGIRKLILTSRPTASACQKSVMIVLSHSPPQMRLIV